MGVSAWPCFTAPLTCHVSPQLTAALARRGWLVRHGSSLLAVNGTVNGLRITTADMSPESCEPLAQDITRSSYFPYTGN